MDTNGLILLLEVPFDILSKIQGNINSFTAHTVVFYLQKPMKWIHHSGPVSKGQSN